MSGCGFKGVHVLHYSEQLPGNQNPEVTAPTAAKHKTSCKQQSVIFNTSVSVRIKQTRRN